MLDQVPIRWRLALLSAGLTFVILCGFALMVGELTQRRVRDDFNRQVSQTADELSRHVGLRFDPRNGRGQLNIPTRYLQLVATRRAALRVLDQSGRQLWISKNAPRFHGLPSTGARVEDGYRVETRTIPVAPFGGAFLQYGRPLSEAEETVQRVRLFLVLGVLGGTAIALLGGVLLARRAMRPIAELTEAADDIRRTRDPGQALEIPPAHDEVAELARTLDAMLRSLDAAQSETEAALDRQREFVADASHELRTPLTSVLANLELLADTLHGDSREAADSALRSSQRMRRLVGDLLLLARADAQRESPRRPLDLGEVVVEAAAEAEPVAAGDHELSVDAEPAWVEGVRDDLHRVALNLIENAMRHTPPGTHVRARVESQDGDAVLVVEDDGPGIPEDLRDRVFERFIRGRGDSGGSSGLGLAIVRAVARQHGGSVRLEDAQPGARFVVRIPAVEAPAREAAAASPA